MKKQHFVPQKSLSRFANSKGKIFVFDKLKGESFEAAINKTACKQYYYDMKSVDHDPTDPERFQISERAFKEIEDIGQPTIEKILTQAEAFSTSRKSPKMSRNRFIYKVDRVKLALFIAVQFLRTPEQRDNIINVVRSGMRVNLNIDLANAGITLTEEEEFDIQLSEECQTGHHVKMALEGGLIAAEEMANQIWMFGVAKNSQLVTSDTPVSLIPDAEDEFAGEGLLARGIQTVCNLSPSVMVLLADRKRFKPFDKMDSRCIVMSHELISYLNMLQLQRCSQYVYSPSEDFRWAQELLSKHPSWRLPPKKNYHCSGPFSEGVNELFESSRTYKKVLFWGREEDSVEINWSAETQSS